MKHIFCCLFACMALQISAQAPGDFIPRKKGEWVLMVEAGTPLPVGIEVLKTLSRETGAYLVSLEGEEVPAARKILENLPGFRSLQPNYYLHSRGVEPDDPYFGDQWSLNRIQAPEAWAFSTGGQTALGEAIVVAVMDDGFDLEHPDLAPHIWINQAEAEGEAGIDDDMNGFADDASGWNFDGAGSPVLPVRNHGTSVLGIIGAVGNNGTGVAGVNWNVRILPLTVRTIGDMIEGYTYVWKMRKRNNETGGAEGAFVAATSLSLGFNKVFCSEFPALESILDSLGREGVLNVAATANGDWDVDQVGDIPTSCVSDYLISVTNSTQFDEKLQEAAYGATSIDLAAPGGEGENGVFTTRAGGYDESFGGTSAACPHVSGAVALLHAMPSLAFAQMAREKPEEAALLVKDAILEGADSIFALQGLTLTGARLNLYKSALYLHGYFQPIDIPDPGQYADRRRIIRVFPNPIATGQPLQIVYGSRFLGTVRLRLFNAQGQLLQEVSVEPEAFKDQLIELPTSHLLSGVYWLVMDNGIYPVAVRVAIF